ncbi:MAG: 4-hydroxy-tetrahydrodipicolinate synthase [Chitinophagales bacterium]|nr:4-hydroxy-tetrahydrodipicolinate synthase [Chitinophagales bacterium]MDW8427513.1 4-hydroxy-tetrahydrodipicolinate synthase [Chitinophagales bacterium]
MSALNLRGTGVALITPFTTEGTLDETALLRLVDHCLAQGVNYFVALGTTAETPTLTAEEKNRILRLLSAHVGSRVPLVAGVGGNNTAEVVEQLKQLDLSGYQAVLSVCPYYNKPTQEGLYQHFLAVAEASPLPVILYNVPGRTASNLSAATTVKLARTHPRIIGIKEASGNLTQIMEIVRDRPEGFLVLSGDDVLTLPLISFGCDGVISVAAQAVPATFCRMVRSALGGDFEMATRLHLKLLTLMDLLFSEGNPAGIKAALHILAIAENVLRLPLVPVSSSLYEKLAEALKSLQHDSG